jgi:hypothetical protein
MCRDPRTAHGVCLLPTRVNQTLCGAALGIPFARYES